MFSFVIGDKEALDLWKKFREMSIENLKQVYQVNENFPFFCIYSFFYSFVQLFNIHYDEYQSESQFSKQAKQIIHQLDQLGYCQQRADGVLEAIIPAQYNTLSRDACIVVRKSDGTTLYITRLVSKKSSAFLSS